MKKKVILSLIFITILCIGTGCSKEKNSKEENIPKPTEEDTSKEVLRNGHFEQRTSFKEKEDGWLYYLQEETDFEDGKGQTGITYDFNGVNLKYASLDDYYIPVIEDNKEIDRIESVPLLVLNKKYKPELQRIDQRLLELKDKIGSVTEEDLSGLQTEYFDKKDIVELFNALEHSKSYANKDDDSVKYANLPPSDVLSEKLANGDTVQLMYAGALQGFIGVRAEVIDAGGKYWSDEVENGKADKEKKEVVRLFQKVSEYIVERQSLDVQREMKKENDSEYADALWKLLDRLEQMADE